MDSKLTVVVPSQMVVALRAGCASIGPVGANMFTTGIGSGGQVTHYISSGLVPESVSRFVTSVADTYGLDVSAEDPLDAMERLNLTFIEEVQS